jgi:uncharacterized iron-regulated protein
MTCFSNHLPTSSIFFTLFLIFCSCCSSAALAAHQEKSDYELSLSFVPQEGQLIGTAKITIDPGRKLTLSVQDLAITGTLLRDETGHEHRLHPTRNMLILPSASTSRTLYISYTRTVKDDFNNLISPEGISLISNWYPRPEQPMLYHVTAVLPNHFSAVMEADTFPLKQQGDTVRATFSRPLTTIHFIAGPYSLDKQRVRDGLFVYSMFFKEDRSLAGDYLQAAAEYLNHYENEIGPYPYNHYVIVANRQPTGYGMPTFTLLGQMVLRLPFIKDTSLGHEIVHSWFGNAVEVDYGEGNWCEGLTSYLADHAYREKQGEGSDDRRESITRYHSYVHQKSSLPLAAFTSASHHQPMADAKRAVGYDKGAFLFHELREKIGRQLFQEGLRRFYADNNGRQANWNDLQKSFEAVSGADLEKFFVERLTRDDIPVLGVEDIQVSSADNGPILSFTLLQQTEKPFSLVIPIEVRTISTTFTIKQEIHEQKTRISIPLDQRPLEFTIDPHHDLLRQLTDEELPAVWSRFMGSPKPLVILAKKNQRALYQPLLDAVGGKELTLTSATELTNQQMSENDLLFLGPDQIPARSLFGLPNHPQLGMTLDVRRNPLNRNKVAVLVSSSGVDQTKAAARRLTHYGKYSYLEFKNGRNVAKKIQSTQSGLRFVLEELPVGGATASLSPFTGVIEKLARARVVYVGESHTSLADHLLQLRIIEALFMKNQKLAIAMEMFPSSSQPALDRYTLSGEEVDERTFLKESDYYNVWGYDYRFFQDILHFARKNHLPVIGINLDRQIVSEVFRSGGTDSLTREVQESLPKDRNLDMQGYSERLSVMHNIHMQGNHGSGAESGFIQAQGIWDETMAVNITNFLTEHPGYQLVVLAGSQHTRKDSGIPPRVARRMAVQQVSVINIYSDSAPADLEQVADYFFLATPTELPESPKMGIILDTQTENGQSVLTISQLSPHGKAAAAGLQTGDILKEVNGYPVSDMADLRIGMLGAKTGQTIDIKVARKKNKKDQELVFKVELTTPPAPPPHP